MKKEIKTKSGFVCEADERITKDWDFLTLLAHIDEGSELEQIKATEELLVKVIGRDGTDKLKEHVKDEDGFAPIDRIIEEFKEILTKMGTKAKKSSPSRK